MALRYGVLPKLELVIEGTTTGQHQGLKILGGNNTWISVLTRVQRGK